jgi:predicted MFS family arabinose efflux permease
MKTTKLTFFTLAVATGLAVSGIYLNQTLLSRLGQVFHVEPSEVGLLATFTQLGYALGIFFLVPLGDTLNKKKLALVKMTALAGALLAAGSSTQLWHLFGASLAIGIFASVAQDFVPIAAEIAPANLRGRVVGVVMSGLLIGILTSRTVSGWIETVLNWRWVFWSFSALIALFIGVVAILIPSAPVAHRVPYKDLMRNLVRLPKREPQLRLALLRHGLVGVAFSAFWTNLAFHLASPEFGLSTLQIGLFGLAGAAGALAAPVAGRLADSRGPTFAIRVGISLVAVSFFGMLLLPHSLLALVIGAIVFDAGTQMSLISHQTIIYSLDPKARSSLNAVFVTGMFLSFALGSMLSTTLFGAFGWVGVMAMGLFASGLALAVKPLLRFASATATFESGADGSQTSEV